MTFYRNIFANTRPYLLATAAGLALSAPSGAAMAQETAGAHTSAMPITGSFAEPRLLPSGQSSAKPVGTKPTESRHSIQLVQGQAGDTAVPRPGLTERFGRIFRAKPTTPPVDPGMVYPKSTDYAGASSPPQAPGASDAQIPSIPPTYGNVPQQPALFQAPTGLSAIGTNEIPPLPAALPEVGPANTAATTASAPPLKNIPELKIIMTSDQPVNTHPPAPGVEMAATPPEVVHSSNLPTLDFNAPIPADPSRIAPGEPSGAPATAQTSAPAPKSADPFADLFPADQNKTAQVEPAKEQPNSGSPYTGLSLDADQEKTNTAMLPPPPAEEQVAAAKNPNLEIPALPEVKTAELPKVNPLALPPAVPPTTVAATTTVTPAPLPTPDLSLPSDPPKLSSISSNEMQITVKPAPPSPPALQPAAAPSTLAPPAQNDQKAKLEMIAARSHLKGLKGFCPVVLREERNLIDTSFEFIATYNGHQYALSSEEARQKFQAEPEKYAPAEGGCDVIHLALTGERQEGSLEHAVWYRGRLYLFSGVETMETFVAAPSSHATIN